MLPKDMFFSGSPAPVIIIMIRARKKTWDKQFLTVCPAPSESRGKLVPCREAPQAKQCPPDPCLPGTNGEGGWDEGVYFAGEVSAGPVHLVGFHPALMSLSYIPIGPLFSIGSGFQHALL